jgi:hypothetical protein
MSVGRQFNWKGQQRVDVAHLRLVESSIAFDFDTLAGQALGGGNPYILQGFTLASWSVGQLPSTLQLITAGSVVFHYPASENGTMLFVPSNRAPETLSSSNARIVGSFTANQVNYVALDYVRLEDATTSGSVQFLDATTKTSTPKTIPLGRVLDYRIHISTVPFSSTANFCPIFKVTLDANGLITTLEDARTMYFRLALGGDSPNPLGTYSWPQGRAPENSQSFTGGDKAITNEKIWKSAIMQRLWEITGGEYWYSDVTDKNIKWYATTIDPLTWNGTTLTWVNLRVALDNSSATINTITDGNHNIVDGEVGYVELNRYSNTPNITLSWAATPAAYNALPPPSRPGCRYIVFWRRGANAYSRLDYTPIGQYSGAATTTTYGVTKISTVNVPAFGPWAVITDTGVNGKAVASGLTRGNISGGTIAIGGGANDNFITLQVNGGITVTSPNGVIVSGVTGGLEGMTLTGGSNVGILGGGIGLNLSGGAGGAGGGYGGDGLYVSGGIGGTGAAGGHGIFAQGGIRGGYGVRGFGGNYGTGTGDGAPGVYGMGGSKGTTGLSYAGHGVFGQGAVTGSNGTGCGVYGIGGVNADGWGSSYGVLGEGAPNANVSSPGVVGTGNTSSGVGGPGVVGYGFGTGALAGVVGYGRNAGAGVEATGGSTGPALRLATRSTEPSSLAGDIYFDSRDGSFFGYNTGRGFTQMGENSLMLSTDWTTTSSTVATISGLSINIQRGYKYAITIHLIFSTASASGVGMSVSGPVTIGTNGFFQIGSALVYATNAVGYGTDYFSSGVTPVFNLIGTTLGTAATCVISSSIFVDTDGSGPTVSLLFNLRSNTNTALTTVKAGSYITWRRIP